MRTIIVVCLILLIGPLSISAQVYTPNTSRSIMLLNNTGTKSRIIKNKKNITIRTIDPKIVKGKFNVLNDEAIDINGESISINNISYVWVKNNSSRTIGFITAITGGALIIAKATEAEEYVVQRGGYGLGAGLLVIGAILTTKKKGYNIPYDWTLSIQ